MRIAHLSSAHPRFDTRIFLKQCVSVAAAGYDISLIVADGKGDAEQDGVHIRDVGRSGGRLKRMVGTTRRVLKEAVLLNADLYHLHDPELIPAGLALKRRGKKVIFDAHEDLPRQILSKSYIHPRLRGAVSEMAALFERWAGSRLDHVVAATPVIRDKFLKAGIASTDIRNYPLASELTAPTTANTDRPLEICYIGGIAETRGIVELVDALALCESEVRLNLAGPFVGAGLREKLASRPGWQRVNELGFLDRSGVRSVLHRSRAGLVTLHPTLAFLDSLPIKMFEYMSAGIPVIASDFPLWRGIIDESDCGICVDPRAAPEIAQAIDRLVSQPDQARRMGENGRNAVDVTYNWAKEEAKLLDLYRRLSQNVGGISA